MHNKQRIQKLTPVANILRNATIVYQDNVTEVFDALQVTDKGVIIGRILHNDMKQIEEFIPCGFIPKSNIHQIQNSIKK